MKMIKMTKEIVMNNYTFGLNTIVAVKLGDIYFVDQIKGT